MKSDAQTVPVGYQISSQDSAFVRAKWRMLFAAMFCYLFFYTGRQTFGFAIPGLQKEFGLTKETLGWASTALLWCYAIGQAINGNLGDKFGGRRVMSTGALLSCVANWVVSFGVGFKTIAIPWGINGYFQSMGWAPGSRLLANWWTTTERGKVFGFYTFAAGCASVLSYLTSLVVIDTFHMDWRWIFRLPVLLMLLGGISFYLIARERPQDMGFEPLPDSATGGAETTVSNGEVESSLERYKAVLKNWRLIVAGCSVGFENAARYGLLVWVPVHFLGKNWKVAPDAFINPKWISIALPVGMAIGALSNGWISDKLFGSKRYKAIMLYMFIGGLTSIWMYTLPGHSMVGIFAVFLCGFFVYGPQSSFWALCPDLVGAKRAGTATGVMNFFSYLFAGLGEPLIGRMMDQSGDTSLVFPVVAVCCFASAGVASFIRR